MQLEALDISTMECDTAYIALPPEVRIFKSAFACATNSHDFEPSPCSRHNWSGIERSGTTSRRIWRGHLSYIVLNHTGSFMATDHGGSSWASAQKQPSALFLMNCH